MFISRQELKDLNTKVDRLDNQIENHLKYSPEIDGKRSRDMAMLRREVEEMRKLLRSFTNPQPMTALRAEDV